MRTTNVILKSVVALPTPPVIAVANTPTTVLPDISKDPIEYNNRYIQNLSSTQICYYALGHDCDLTNYNGILQPYQQLDLSNFPGKVSVYSQNSGAAFGVTVLVNNDLMKGQGGIISLSGNDPRA